MSDNISRQAAMDAVNKIAPVDTEYDCTLLDRIDVRYVLTELPSTDRTGKWLKNKHWSSERWEVDYKCSECGYITVFTPKYVPFCPNCGADMRGSSMRMIRDLTEMNKLEDYLKANGFEYQREDEDAEPMDKHQIIVFENGVRSWDVICHYGSYGGDEGLLEGMGDLFGPDVDGYLTAEDVIKKIEEVRS